MKGRCVEHILLASMHDKAKIGGESTGKRSASTNNICVYDKRSPT